MKSLGASLWFLAKSAVAGLAIAFVAVWLKPDLLAPQTGTGQAAGGTPQPVAGAVSYAEAVASSAPAVVNVYSTKRVTTQGRSLFDHPFFRELYPNQAPETRERTQNSLGSGVLVSGDGYILTNFHVIDGAEEIWVALNDGRVAQARRVGADPDTDIALLKISASGLPTMRLGRSDTLRIGDVVLAIGNPFGIGQTVTQGIVSATGRSRLGLSIFENHIQTDASINPGNSGGALITADGALVGLNTAIFSRDQQSEGIGFAIPVNLVRGVMTQLIEHGRVIRGWIGVNAQNLSPSIRDSLRLDDVDGVILSRVIPNTPADAAGLRAGDVITQINDQPVRQWQEAVSAVARLTPSARVKLNGLREGRPFEVEVQVIERPVRQRRAGS